MQGLVCCSLMRRSCRLRCWSGGWVLPAVSGATREVVHDGTTHFSWEGAVPPPPLARLLPPPPVPVHLPLCPRAPPQTARNHLQLYALNQSSEALWRLPSGGEVRGRGLRGGKRIERGEGTVGEHREMLDNAIGTCFRLPNPPIFLLLQLCSPNCFCNCPLSCPLPLSIPHPPSGAPHQPLPLPLAAPGLRHRAHRGSGRGCQVAAGGVEQRHDAGLLLAGQGEGGGVGGPWVGGWVR